MSGFYIREALFGVGLWRRRLRFHAGEGAPPRLLLASLLRDLAGRGDARLLELAHVGAGETLVQLDTRQERAQQAERDTQRAPGFSPQASFRIG